MDTFVKACVSTASCGLSRVFLNPDEEPLPTIPSSCSSTTCKSLSPRQLKKNEECWVRPLGYAERFMTLASYFGNMTTVYALWLDSRGPIDYDKIKQATHIVYRKMPHLRMCIQWHNWDRWWREMDSERLDIEEVRTNNVKDTFEKLLRHRYNISEGPLWFVRFLMLPEAECLVRDTNYNLKHKYVCIFGFHHNVADGSTNMKFCDVFLRVLNDLLKGKEVDMREEGYFASPLHDKLADHVSTFAWRNSVFVKRLYKGILAYCLYVKNFVNYYPLQSDVDGGTTVICRELDEINTDRLLKRCRMEQVTLNSAFTAAANIGMYRMILQHNSSLTRTSFDSQQTINMRRYWPKEMKKNSFGCHISMIDIQIPTEKEDIDNFWEYTRRIHEVLREDLNVSKRPLKIQPLSERLWLAILVNFVANKLRVPSTNDSHYCITNMGDVSSTFSGEGEEVEVARILRSVTCHFMQALCQHTLQTFKGKFYYSLDYYPQKMSAATARAYASSLMDCLRTAIHTPN